MPKKIPSSKTDTPVVDPQCLLEVADRARELNDRATTEIIIALVYANLEAKYAGEPLPHAEAIPAPSAPPLEPGPEPLTIRKFWQK